MTPLNNTPSVCLPEIRCTAAPDPLRSMAMTPVDKGGSVTENAANTLRKLIITDGIVVAPAVYDCLTAMLAEQAGFQMVFTSGFGISASLIGRPDIGLLTATEMMDRVRYICRSVSIPVVADIDTGYGNAMNVMRTVEEAVAAGAAGVILEDQVWPKRCGHFEGKAVIPTEEHVEKIIAAREARGGSGLVIVARTDARAVMGLDTAIERARAYADAGADVVFVEAPEAEAELAVIAERLRGTPLFANLIEGGKTPTLSVERLERMGFKLVAFALTALFAATFGVRKVFRQLVAEGTSGDLMSQFSFADFAEVIGLDRYMERRIIPSTKEKRR